MVRGNVGAGTLLAPFSRPFPKIVFFMHFGRPLAPFGTLSAPSGSLWAPVGSLSAHFGHLLAPFCTLLAPFGSLLAPFWLIFTNFHDFSRISMYFHEFSRFCTNFHEFSCFSKVDTISRVELAAFIKTKKTVAGTRLCRAQDILFILICI